MQSASFCAPAGAPASLSRPFSVSAPTGQGGKLSNLDEEQLELTERDLWEDNAGVVLCLSAHQIRLYSCFLVDNIVWRQHNVI